MNLYDMAKFTKSTYLASSMFACDTGRSGTLWLAYPAHACAASVAFLSKLLLRCSTSDGPLRNYFGRVENLLPISNSNMLYTGTSGLLPCVALTVAAGFPESAVR